MAGPVRTRLDLTGQSFGRLRVKADAGTQKHGHSHWLCICQCGAETTVRGSNLINGFTTSCGCRRREVSALLAARRFDK